MRKCSQCHELHVTIQSQSGLTHQKDEGRSEGIQLQPQYANIVVSGNVPSIAREPLLNCGMYAKVPFGYWMEGDVNAWRSWCQGSEGTTKRQHRVVIANSQTT